MTENYNYLELQGTKFTQYPFPRTFRPELLPKLVPQTYTTNRGATEVVETDIKPDQNKFLPSIY